MFNFTFSFLGMDVWVRERVVSSAMQIERGSTQLRSIVEIAQSIRYRGYHATSGTSR